MSLTVPALAVWYQFTPINFPGAQETFPVRINENGQIVGVYIDDNSKQHGFLLSTGTYTAIDIPSANNTAAAGINNHSEIVGRFNQSSNPLPPWVGNQGWLLDDTGLSLIAARQASDINDAGEIVGTDVVSGQPSRLGFVKSGETFTQFQVGAAATQAFGINNSGHVVGIFDVGDCCLDGVRRGYLKIGSTFEPIDVPLPGVHLTEPVDINDTGLISGWFRDDFESGLIHGFLYDGDTHTQFDIPFVGADNTHIQGTTTDKRIVGSYRLNGLNRGFLGHPLDLDIDGNGVADALTDGILILRYLFQFTGDALISDALASACTRCTAEAVETFLDDLPLDIDGNTLADALTDGILLLRLVFEFTGDALISGAVALDCTRCTAGEMPYRPMIIPN